MGTRKHFSAEEKVAILRRHLIEKVPVSDLCDQFCACLTRSRRRLSMHAPGTGAVGQPLNEFVGTGRPFMAAFRSG